MIKKIAISIKLLRKLRIPIRPTKKHVPRRYPVSLGSFGYSRPSHIEIDIPRIIRSTRYSRTHPSIRKANIQVVIMHEIGEQVARRRFERFIESIKRKRPILERQLQRQIKRTGKSQKPMKRKEAIERTERLIELAKSRRPTIMYKRMFEEKIGGKEFTHIGLLPQILEQIVGIRSLYSKIRGMHLQAPVIREIRIASMPKILLRGELTPIIRAVRGKERKLLGFSIWD